jgi:hypothetical protein
VNKQQIVNVKDLCKASGIQDLNPVGSTKLIRTILTNVNDGNNLDLLKRGEKFVLKEFATSSLFTASVVTNPPFKICNYENNLNNSDGSGVNFQGHANDSERMSGGCVRQ